VQETGIEIKQEAISEFVELKKKMEAALNGSS